MKVVTGENTIADILHQYPSTRRIFDQHGLRGCGGQHGPAESLSFFSRVHQVDLPLLLRELNAELESPASECRYQESLEDVIYRRFFAAGIVIAITVGVLWGAINLLQIALHGSFSQPGLVPAIHAHAHAMVYGWVCLFVMGFAYQSFPRFKNTRLWRPDWANWTFYLMLAGIGARVAAELLQPAVIGMVLGGLSAAVELLAVALFVTILYQTACQSIEPPSSYEKFIFASLFWLVLGTGFSHAFFFAKATSASASQLAARIATMDGPLRDLQLFGFAALIIAGISQRFVPLVYGLSRPRRDRHNLIFILMNAALVANVVGYVGLRRTQNSLFAIGLEAAYLLTLLWAVLLVKQLNIFSRSQGPDRTFKFVRAAYVWLLISCGMLPFFLLYSKLTGQPFAHSYMGAHRHAFTVGFISFMIIGTASRVVPMLAGVPLGTRLSSLWGPFLLFNVGCTGRVLLQIASDFTRHAYPLVGVTGFIELTALSWWGLEMWRTMRQAMKYRAAGPGSPPAHPSGLIKIATAS